MFNFHKPRTYRSTEGCCICRAKSSSSRFTDSRKYERDTMQCFDLKYPRQGEICNACVLLVKRYKRLPVGSKRNWSHVVDARAGPGGSKIQTKYKSERISSRSTNQNGGGCPGSSSSLALVNSAGSAASSAVHSSSATSFTPEKFSKIFNKSKKIKESASSSGPYSSSSLHKHRKFSNNGWSQNTSHSLPTTPDSLDSDYEDSRTYGALAGTGAAGTVVQFQTQTRASTFRAQAAAEARRRYLKLGSRRRKRLRPRKNRSSIALDESIPFFDEKEWREKQGCCGIKYECPALGGALLLDVNKYKPCEQHKAASVPQQRMQESGTVKDQPMVPMQKAIIQTMPAVVQLQPPATLATSSNTAHSTGSSSLTITKTTTPVLKKHHLFFKRQSECFPQGDMVTPSETTNCYTTPSKTESDYSNQTTQQLHPPSTTILQRHNENAIQSSATAVAANNYSISSAALSISVTSAAVPAQAMPVSLPSSSSSSSSSLPSSTYPCMPQMPKHSLAKVTTISPPLTPPNVTSSPMPTTKPHSSGFLHKIKSDPGKIVKHSLDKFNTAVRLKASELNDLKPLIKTVDKSHILTKPPTISNVNCQNTATTATYQALSTYNSSTGQPLTTTVLSAASPTSSTSSTKFNDNSSDSGYDENLLDRKSASPLHEDCDKKNRCSAQTMFLANGMQIHGQPQNILLTGNEVAAKILQNRKYNPIITAPIAASNARSLSTNHPTTTAVKIAQISTGASVSPLSSSTAVSIMNSVVQAKMRAIYNSSNTIQHENGITTIVPASSLAATTQTAAMQNIAPSSVTITPAPLAVGCGAATPFNTQNIISRKLTAANIINLQSNHLSNNATTHLNSSNNSHGGGIGNHLMNSSAATANQKIILLKTSPNSMATQQQQLSTASASAASLSKYSTLQATTGVGGGSVGGGNGGVMMGR